MALLGTAVAAAVVAATVIALVGPGGETLSGPTVTTAPSVPPEEALRVVSERVLPLRAADPRGGPPWGLRLAVTSRGKTCLQVGRLRGGRFGDLGVDGAFGGDGRLHPASPTQASGAAGTYSAPVNYECVEAGETFAGEIGALDRSAAFGAQERSVAGADLRRVSYGLLGRHALAITYRTAHGRRTVRLRAPLGAYLIVQPVDADHYRPGSGAAPGDDRPSQLRSAGPTGALTSIEYRYGARDCRQGIDDRSCSASLPPPTGTG